MKYYVIRNKKKLMILFVIQMNLKKKIILKHNQK